MAVGQSTLVNTFDKYKKQGLTDSEAMKRAMEDRAKRIAKLRAADAAKRVKTAEKKNWVRRLKRKVQAAFKARTLAKETTMKKRYLKYYEKVGPGTRTLTYSQWLKDQIK